jgi:hypothetical protein
MELISVTTGSWFPRTKLHLKEAFRFFGEGTSHLGLDEKKLAELRAALGPKDVRYVGGRFDRMVAELAGGVSCVYHEDGLLLLSKTVSDFDQDLEDLRRVYDDRVAMALSMIFSVGTPVVSFSIPHIGVRPAIVLVKGATDAEVAAFCAGRGDAVHYIARHPERTVHYADRLIVIDDETGGAGSTRYVVESLVLAREYEHKLQHYLDLHRKLWTSIERIQERGSIPSFELPVLRNSLLNHRRDLGVIRARVHQMRAYLLERKAEIDDLGLAQDMRAVETYRYAKLESATAYIDELWGMLAEYLDATVQITGLMYQEHLQREIGVQQFIFLIGAAASVIALGTVAGASFLATGPEGFSVRGTLTSFDPATLFLFGSAALAVSIVVFFGIGPLVKIMTRIKSAAVFGRASENAPDKRRH